MVNAWPAECVRLFELCRKGEFDAARPLYRILTPAFHLDTNVKLVQYIKFAEHLVYGAPEAVRRLRLPLAGAERNEVAAIIKATIAALAEYSRKTA
jgi:4-hydroxy-tetrahydrodipicolinate synthase